MTKQSGYNLVRLLMLGLATAGVIFVFYAYQQNEQAAPEVSQSQKSGYQYPEPRHATGI